MLILSMAVVINFFKDLNHIRIDLFFLTDVVVFLKIVSRCNDPFLSTHWTELICDHVRLVEPFFDAMYVETMATSARNQRTIISGCFAVSTTIVEGIPTDTAIFMLDCPLPGGHTEKAIYFDIHYYWMIFITLVDGLSCQTLLALVLIFYARFWQQFFVQILSVRSTRSATDAPITIQSRSLR